MNNYSIRIIATFYIGIITSVSVQASEKIYSLQYNGTTYVATYDLRIRWDTPSRTECYGLDLVVNSINRSLIKFNDLNIPAGKYSVELQLTANYINSGTSALVTVEFLNDTTWTDPHAYLNPPPTDSTNPTWDYVHYSSKTWDEPGASGPLDRGGSLGKHVISSVSEPYSFFGTTTIGKGQTALAFIATATSGANIWFCCQENSGDSYFLNPKLILTGPKNRGGLDRNLFSEPFKPLR